MTSAPRRGEQGVQQPQRVLRLQHGPQHGDHVVPVNPVGHPAVRESLSAKHPLDQRRQNPSNAMFANRE